MDKSAAPLFGTLPFIILLLLKQKRERSLTTTLNTPHIPQTSLNHHTLLDHQFLP